MTSVQLALDPTHAECTTGLVTEAADDLPAIDPLPSLVATLVSWFSRYSLDRYGPHAIERVSDATFIAAIPLLTAACSDLTCVRSLPSNAGGGARAPASARPRPARW